MPYSIDELKSIIVPIAKAYGVDAVSLFGSYSRGTADSDSDIDILIKKGKVSSLFALTGFRLALEDVLHKPVDIVTYTSADKDFLNIILKDEVLLYQSA